MRFVLALACSFARLSGRFSAISLGDLKYGARHRFKVFQGFRAFKVFGLFHMDYVTRQFIKLVKHFRKDLRYTLEKNTNAIRDAVKATRENKQGPLPIPLPIRAELQVPEADKTDQRTQYKRSHTLQIWLTVGTWLAFIAAAIYAGIAHSQLDQMKIATRNAGDAAIAAGRAATATEQANTDARERFRTDERPWLIPQPHGSYSRPGGGETVNELMPDGSIHFGVFIQILNIGRSPAIKVIDSNTEYIYGPKDKARSDVRKFVPKYDAPAIFLSPGVPGMAPHSETKTFTKDENIRLGDGTWELYVVGGVLYEDTFIPEIKPYQTTYCWRVLPVGFPFGACDLPKPSFNNSIR